MGNEETMNDKKENQICFKSEDLAKVVQEALKIAGYKTRTAPSRNSTQVFYQLKR